MNINMLWILGELSELQKKEFEKSNKNSSFYFDLIKNKNFLNNQNYLKSKKILKKLKKSMNMDVKIWAEKNRNYMENFIWFNPLKIFQEIEINNLTYGFNKAKFFLIFMLLIILIFSYFIPSKDEIFSKIFFNIWIWSLSLFFIIFILGMIFAPKQRNYKFYFNKDKILIFNTLLFKQTKKLPKITRI